MNPQVYSTWMSASMNPQTYQPMYVFMNPALYMQWMTAAMDPQFYQSMAPMIDPSKVQEMFAAMAQNPAFAAATAQ